MSVRGADVAVLVLVPVAVLALIWFLDRTLIGKTVKACASNPSLARLSAISPKMVSTMVWALAAALSTLSVVLIAGESSTAAGLATLGPQTLSEALAAAVIAGMRSFRVAVLAAVAIGVIQSVLTYNFLAVPGITDLLLFIAVFVAVVFAKREGEDSQVFAFSPRANPIPARLRSIWWARNIDKGGILLLGLFAVLLPLVVTEPSRQQLYTAVLAFAICASSLTVLTGWLGQLSLGQMAFAGLAALFAARLVNDGVNFWVAIATTTVASALARVGHRHRIAAGARPVSRRRHLRLRADGPAVLLLPALLLGGLARRGQRPLPTRPTVVHHLQRPARLLLRRPRRAGPGHRGAEPLPRQRRGAQDQGGARQRDRGRRVHRADRAREAAGVLARRRARRASAARSWPERSPTSPSPRASSWSTTRSTSSPWW